jgi:hypothetical protein
MMIFKSIGVVTLLLCFSGLLGSFVVYAGSTPEWVETGRHPKYPNSVFILGVGSALEQSDAESNALSSIGKQISSKVQTSARSEVSSFGESVSSLFSQNVAVESSEKIGGVSFVERFKNADNIWNVLAVVKISELVAQRRHDADECYRKALRAKDSDLKSATQRSAIEVFQDAIDLQVRNSACSKKHTDFLSLNPFFGSSQGLLKDDTSASLEANASLLKGASSKALDELRKLSFATLCERRLDDGKTKAAEMEGSSAICESFEGVLIDFGLKKTRENGSFFLKIGSSVRNKNVRSSALTFLRARVDLEMVDSSSHKVFFKSTIEEEAGGASFEGALAKLEKKSSEKLISTFLQSFRKVE